MAQSREHGGAAAGTFNLFPLKFYKITGTNVGSADTVDSNGLITSMGNYSKAVGLLSGQYRIAFVGPRSDDGFIIGIEDDGTSDHSSDIDSLVTQITGVSTTVSQKQLSFTELNAGIDIENQSVTFGADTLEGAGAFTPTYTGDTITSVTINSGDPSGHFEDDGNGNIVPTAAGAGNLSGPYSLNVTYSAGEVQETITLTVNTESNSYSVASCTELNAAISDGSTAGGFTIKCRPGAYTDVIDRGGTIKTFSSDVTVSSYGNTTIEQIYFNVGISGIIFDGLDFQYDAANGESGIFLTGGASNVTFTNCTFTGIATGYRATVEDTAGGGGINTSSATSTIVIQGCTFSKLSRAIALLGGSNHEISGCTFEYIQGDSINIWNCTDTLIDNNTFRLRYGTAYAINHDDDIQFARPTGSDINMDNITITNNVFIQAPNQDLNPNQIIFGRNEYVEPPVVNEGGFPTSGHSNFNLSNNVVVASGSHHISVASINGYNCDNNTVIRSYENTGGTGANINVGNTTSVTMENNVAPAYVDAGGSILSTNHIVSVFNNFSSPLDQIYLWKNPQKSYLTMTIDDLVVNPFGPIHKASDSAFGSPLTAFDESLPASLTAQAFRKWTTDSGPLTVTCDASYSADSSGLMTGGNATFSWNWGDGNISSGISATHTYTTAGTYTITLTVTRNSDSATATDTLTHIAYNSLAFDVDFADGSTTVTSGYSLVQNGTRTQVLDGVEYGQRITDGNEVQVQSTGAASSFWGTSELSFELDFALVSGAPDGFMSMANSAYGIQYDKDTEEITWYVDDDGNTRWTVVTSGLGLANTDTNRYSLKAAYSSTKGTMQLDVYDSENTLVSSVSGNAGGVTGVPASSSHHIHIGSISFGASTSFDVYDFKAHFLDIIDMTPNAAEPTLSSSTPADNATGVAVDADISLTFNVPIKAVPGSNSNITLHRTSDDVQVAAWNILDDVEEVTKSSLITGLSTLTVTLVSQGNLDATTEHYLLIPNDVFQSPGGTAYAGISDTTALSFTTV